MNRLPLDVIEKIYSFLPCCYLVEATSISKHYNQLKQRNAHIKAKEERDIRYSVKTAHRPAWTMIDDHYITAILKASQNFGWLQLFLSYIIKTKNYALLELLLKNKRITHNLSKWLLFGQALKNRDKQIFYYCLTLGLPKDYIIDEILKTGNEEFLDMVLDLGFCL